MEVLALPYYRHSRLVDVRYLHIENNCLRGSWLAVSSCELFMLADTEVLMDLDRANPQQQRQQVWLQHTALCCPTTPADAPSVCP